LLKRRDTLHSRFSKSKKEKFTSNVRKGGVADVLSCTRLVAEGVASISSVLLVAFVWLPFLRGMPSGLTAQRAAGVSSKPIRPERINFQSQHAAERGSSGPSNR